MKNLLKKLTVSLSAVVIFISMTATPVPAKAGLLFSASGLGLILIWIGLVNDRADLFFLDAEGNISNEPIAKQIAVKYPELDQMAVQDLTNAITEKVTTAATQNGSNQILITMSRSEISSALEASQVEENQPVLFEKIVSDLK